MRKNRVNIRKWSKSTFIHPPQHKPTVPVTWSCWRWATEARAISEREILAKDPVNNRAGISPVCDSLGVVPSEMLHLGVLSASDLHMQSWHHRRPCSWKPYSSKTKSVTRCFFSHAWFSLIFELYYKKYSVFVVDVVGNMNFANAQDAEVKLARERTETQQRRIQTLENEAVVAGVGECFRGRDQLG